MKSVVLVVLDGWGIGPKNETNPIYTANTETMEYIEEYYPAGSLNASGISVGLPWGEEGNSEVGHLTLGAGRVLYQHFLRITKSIERGDFYDNEALKGAFNHSKQNNSQTHLVGLLTDGNVHASIEHLKALIEMASQQGAENVHLHLFTDGKDSPPKSAGDLIEEVREEIEEAGVGNIATIVGRYWAMDREEHWKRTQKAYQALVGTPEVKKVPQALGETYDENMNDSHVEPASIGEPTPIESDDSVIFFNFREDSMKQIVNPFVNNRFNQFQTKDLDNLFVTTMTQYDEDFPAHVAFPPRDIKNTLGEILSDKNKIQMRVAESVKQDHVTYFFNGLKKGAFDGEYRVIIPSANIGNVADAPAMKAESITNRILLSLQDGSSHFILANYANPDVIAHTGNFQATEQAVEVIDRQINELLRYVINEGHILIVTSDHGNAEVLFDPQTGAAETSHDPNPVPFYLIGKEFQQSSLGSPGSLPNLGVLADIAPTVLDIMNIDQPKEMTGKSLLDLI